MTRVLAFLLTFLLLPLPAAAALDRQLVAAAENGDAAAQATLAALYLNAEGVLRDFDKALYWNIKAAGQGHARAQTNLGFMYDAGMGVTRDHAAALEWYIKSANQGDAIAQANIGSLYTEGLGVRRDYAEALFWFTLAAQSGDVPDAVFARDAVALRLDEQVQSAVRQRVQSWKPSRK